MIVPILLIAYDFHPFVGGGGSVRMVKLAKYLHRDGLPIIVLTGGFESKDADPSLGSELEGITISVANPHPVAPSVQDKARRPRWLRVAGWVFRSVIPFPDNRFRYLPAMLRRAKALILEHGIDTVLITSPPNSMSLLVPLLRRWRPNLKLVLDVRDMWALDPLQTPNTAWFRWTQTHLERWTINQADRVVSVTPGFDAWIRQQLREPERAALITNGYDEEDFGPDLPQPEPGGLVLGYAGATGGISGPYSFQGILDALDKVLDRRPQLVGRLVLRIYGHNNRALAQRVAAMRHPEVVELCGFLAHRQVLRALSACHILLNYMFTMPNGHLVYPGKTFEYLRLGRPILLASPPGILRELILESGRGEAADGEDADGIAAALERMLDRLAQGGYPERPDFHLRYERGALARRYAGLLRELAALPVNRR
ncbi:MAG: glycosyltransferase family 4 protein [Candidatus Delongbacteria bacterium]